MMFLLNSIKSRNSNSGFALIEVLVAVAIFGAVATVIYTTFYTGIRAYRRAQGELDVYRQVGQVLDQMSVELRNCYDAEYDEQSGNGGFIAGQRGLSFFTLKNVYSDNESIKSFKSLARISYSFKDGRLFKKMLAGKNVFSDPEGFAEEELIGDLQDLSFQYLYAANTYRDDNSYEWKPQWSDRALVPLGIRVQLVIFEPKEKIQLSLKRDILLSQGVEGAEE